MLNFLLNTEKGVYIILTITSIMWGANAVTAKYVVEQLSPSMVTLVRFFWVSIILIMMAVFIEGKKAVLTRKQLPGIIALAITGIFLNNAFYFHGIKLSTATNAALLSAVNPAITAILSMLFLKEKLIATQLIGIIVSFIGVGAIVTKGAWYALVNLTFNFGDILLLFGSISWSLYAVLGRKVMQDLSAITSTAWAMLFGTMFFAIQAFYEKADFNVSLSLAGWGSMLFMIFGSGVLSFYFWNQGVSIIGPNRASVFINVIPLAGMVCAAIFLGEQILTAQLLGALLIIGGVCMTTNAEKIMEWCKTHHYKLLRSNN